MDYEQKYKEALERARIWKDKSGMSKDKQGILDIIFPELKESEDERIRKTLIDYFNTCHGDYYGELKRKDILAWLEKQGEQKSAWSREDEGFLDSALWHVKNSITNGKIKAFVECPLSTWLKSLKDRVQPKPKQEWSEEDEDYYDAIITKLEVTQDDAALTDNQMEFLKSLKGRVRPKQEWSKEDKVRIEQICDDLKCGLENFRSGKNVKGLHFEEIIKSNIDWLKSLKSKNTWKPSEDQMKALDNALSLAKNCGEDYSFDLRTLLEQLKKLKKYEKLY